MVGSGIVGSSAAYHAARLGAEVVLVDRADRGQATAAGAGIVCPWLSRITRPAWQAIAWPAAAYYPKLLAELPDDDVAYANVGAIFLDATGETHRLAMERRAVAPQMGDVLPLAPGRPRELFPPLRADLAGVFIGGAARVDGRLLRDALQRAASAHGVTVRTGAARLSVGNGGLVGVDVEGETIRADAVVAAAGAWTGEFCAPSGIALPVAPQRGQIVHVELPGADTGRWPIVQPPGSHYLLAFPGSRVVFGATRETGSGFDYRLTAGGVASVLAEALDVAPGLADATMLETRVGFRPLAADELPLLGPARRLPGLVIATGLGPTGLTIGPYAGMIAANLAVGEPAPIDIGPYAPER